MNFELLRIAIALLGTSIAAYQDWKTSYIDDKILYTMIATGLLLNIATFDTNFIAFSIGGALLIAIAGYFTYKQGQFGGGDVLLFAALQLLLPLAPLETTSAINITTLLNNSIFTTAASLFPFFVSIFATASLLALIASSCGYAYQLHLKKIQWRPDKIVTFAIIALTVTFLVWFNSVRQLTIGQTSLFILMAASAVFSTAMKKQVMKEIIVKKIKISEVEDEDILATEEMDKKIIEKYGVERVLTRENVEKLKKVQRETGMNLFPVYKNLPRFGPYVLAGLILNLLLLNFLAFVLFI